jgi:hypothetical protein
MSSLAIERMRARLAMEDSDAETKKVEREKTKMPTTCSPLEQEFLNALAATLERQQFKGFDTSQVTGFVHGNEQRLGAALDALIPNGRYKTGYRRGRFKDQPVRQLLNDMAKRGLFSAQGPQDWWFLPQHPCPRFQ